VVTVLVGAIVFVAVLAALLVAHRHRARRRPDPSWRPVALRRTTPSSYDQGKASAAAKAARLHSPTGRLYVVHRKRKTEA